MASTSMIVLMSSDNEEIPVGTSNAMIVGMLSASTFCETHLRSTDMVNLQSVKLPSAPSWSRTWWRTLAMRQLLKPFRFRTYVINLAFRPHWSRIWSSLARSTQLFSRKLSNGANITALTLRLPPTMILTHGRRQLISRSGTRSLCRSTRRCCLRSSL